MVLVFFFVGFFCVQFVWLIELLLNTLFGCVAVCSSVCLPWCWTCLNIDKERSTWSHIHTKSKWREKQIDEHREEIKKLEQIEKEKSSTEISQAETENFLLNSIIEYLNEREYTLILVDILCNIFFLHCFGWYILCFMANFLANKNTKNWFKVF